MANILDILTRAQALRQETALNSITPDRAGGIMYDTLILINQMQLEGGSLLISKVYSSVAAMEADTTPTSDLTGRALRPGQLAVIVPSSSSSSDMGSVYRYNEPGSWTLCGKIGGLPLDTVPIQGSSNGITSGAVYNALSALRNEGYKYMGIATPGSGGTAPGTPNQPVFYVAAAGSYPNFGNLTVASGHLGFLKYSNGSWTVESIEVGKDYDEEISQLQQKVDENLTTAPYSPEVTSYPGLVVYPSSILGNGSWITDAIKVKKGQTIKITTSGIAASRTGFTTVNPASGVAISDFQQFGTSDAARAATFVAAQDGFFCASRETGEPTSTFLVSNIGLAKQFEDFKEETDDNFGNVNERFVAVQEEMDYNFTSEDIEKEVTTLQGLLLTSTSIAGNGNWLTDYVAVKKGQRFKITTQGIAASRTGFTSETPASGVAVIDYIQHPTSDATRAATYIAGQDGYFCASRETGEPTSVIVLLNDGVSSRLSKLDGSNEDADILFPSFIFGVYNDGDAFRQVVQRVYPEGVFSSRTNMRIRPSLVAKFGQNTGAIDTEQKDISATMNEVEVSSGSFDFVRTKLSNINGKLVKHLAIGDSWTAAEFDTMRGEPFGPWNYTSKVVDDFKKATIDLQDNTAKFVSIGGTDGHFNSRQATYKNETYTIRARIEGRGGWSTQSYLRMPMNFYASDAPVLWDALGLGRRIPYGQAYDEGAEYTPYVAIVQNIVTCFSTAMGYYHWDYSTALMNFCGISGTYTGTEEQKAAIDSYMENLLDNPTNPFYDRSVAMQSGGQYAFNMSKYLERYKTLADDGETRLEIGTTAGTKILTASQLAYIDVCTPTHITIELGVNDYKYIPASQRAEDTILLAQRCAALNNSVKVGIVMVHIPGVFDASFYENIGVFNEISDAQMGVYYSNQTGIYWVNKAICNAIGDLSAMASSRIYYVPTYFVHRNTRAGAFINDEGIIVDGTDDLHPALDVHEEIGHQIFSWIVYSA